VLTIKMFEGLHPKSLLFGIRIKKNNT
jgi:hypothetical protein